MTEPNTELARAIHTSRLATGYTIVFAVGARLLSPDRSGPRYFTFVAIVGVLLLIWQAVATRRVIMLRHQSGLNWRGRPKPAHL